MPGRSSRIELTRFQEQAVKGRFHQRVVPGPVVRAAECVGGGLVSDHALSVRQPLGKEADEIAEFDRQLLVSGVVVVALAAFGRALLAK